jgi:hypothetical protein
MRRVFYGMRRANGDWFAVEVRGESRVPVFGSLNGTRRARAKNPELSLFRPALLDERAFDDLATAQDGRPVGFLVVDEDDPAASLTRGHPLGFEQFAILAGANRLPRPRGSEARRSDSADRGTESSPSRPATPRAAKRQTQGRRLLEEVTAVETRDRMLLRA